MIFNFIVKTLSLWSKESKENRIPKIKNLRKKNASTVNSRLPSGFQKSIKGNGPTRASRTEFLKFSIIKILRMKMIKCQKNNYDALINVFKFLLNKALIFSFRTSQIAPKSSQTPAKEARIEPSEASAATSHFQ